MHGEYQACMGSTKHACVRGSRRSHSDFVSDATFDESCPGSFSGSWTDSPCDVMAVAAALGGAERAA